MKKLLTLALGLSLLGAFAPAALRAADADNGGKKRPKLTEEQRKLRKEMVEKYDTNKDGKLDKAERARISKPLVYEHFGSKEGLHAVVIDREVQELVTRLRSALDAGHPRAALEHVVDAFLRYVEEEQAGFRVLVRDAPVGSSGGSLPSVLADVATSVEALLARELRARGYDRKMAPVLARALVGMVALTGQWWLDEGKPKRGVVTASLVNLVWNGLKDLKRDPMSG